jgi:hypothetical protein
MDARRALLADEWAMVAGIDTYRNHLYEREGDREFMIECLIREFGDLT